MTHFDLSYCMLIKPKCGFQTQFFIGSIQKVPLIKSSIRDEYCLTTLGPNVKNLTRVFNCNWLIFEFHLLEPSNWTLFLGWLSLSSNQLIDPVKVKSNIHGHLDHWTTVKVNPKNQWFQDFSGVLKLFDLSHVTWSVVKII